MTHQEEVSIVEKALNLQKSLDSQSAKLEACREETPPKEPQPPAQPTREIYALRYPPCQSNLTYFDWQFSSAAGIICFIIIIVTFFTILIPLITYIIAYYVFFKNAKEQDTLRLQNTPEYQDACRRAEEYAIYQNAVFEEQYQKEVEQYNLDVEEYNTKTLPEYPQKRAEWEKTHTEELNTLQQSVSNLTDSLQKHYTDTKLIPAKYREINVLEYVYDVISNSEYTYKEAIEQYEREIDRMQENQKIQSMNEENQLLAEQNSLINEANHLTHETNQIADQARREANFAATVNFFQNHNTNRYLRDMSRRR